MLKIFLKIIIGAILVFLFCFMFTWGALVMVGYYLSPKDNLEKADAIIVLSGGGDERLSKSIDLLEKGYADYIIFSGAARDLGPSNAKAMKLKAIRKGVEPQQILIEEKSQNTYENALFTKESVLENNFNKIILVTSSYHQRRAYLTFKSVYQDTEIKILNAPAEISWWDSSHWWKNPKSNAIGKEEILKIFWGKITNSWE